MADKLESKNAITPSLLDNAKDAVKAFSQCAAAPVAGMTAGIASYAVMPVVAVSARAVANSKGEQFESGSLMEKLAYEAPVFTPIAVAHKTFESIDDGSIQKNHPTACKLGAMVGYPAAALEAAGAAAAAVLITPVAAAAVVGSYVAEKVADTTNSPLSSQAYAKLPRAGTKNTALR